MAIHRIRNVWIRRAAIVAYAPFLFLAILVLSLPIITVDAFIWTVKAAKRSWRHRRPASPT